MSGKMQQYRAAVHFAVLPAPGTWLCKVLCGAPIVNVLVGGPWEKSNQTRCGFLAIIENYLSAAIGALVRRSTICRTTWVTMMV